MATFEWHIIDCPNIEGLLQTEKTFVTRATVKKKRLCMIRHKGELYAISDRCSHAGGPLHQGKINDNNQIICPWHRFPFDIETGQSDSGGYFVETYEVKCENRTVYVKMKKRNWLGF